MWKRQIIMIIVIISRELLEFLGGKPRLIQIYACPAALAVQLDVFRSWSAEWLESYCCKFYSEEDKHIAVNRLSFGVATFCSKEHTKKIYNYIATYRI